MKSQSLAKVASKVVFRGKGFGLSSDGGLRSIQDLLFTFGFY